MYVCDCATVVDVVHSLEPFACASVAAAANVAARWSFTLKTVGAHLAGGCNILRASNAPFSSAHCSQLLASVRSLALVCVARRSARKQTAQPPPEHFDGANGRCDETFPTHPLVGINFKQNLPEAQDV